MLGHTAAHTAVVIARCSEDGNRFRKEDADTAPDLDVALFSVEPAAMNGCLRRTSLQLLRGCVTNLGCALASISMIAPGAAAQHKFARSTAGWGLRRGESSRGHRLQSGRPRCATSRGPGCLSQR